MQRGIATFTLDYGKCPPWLWQRMVRLGKEMVRVLVEEYGAEEFVKRIADPVWFQSLGTVLAFDWNASGLTTILTAALKEAIRGSERELGIFICGGKGKTSRKTPEEITSWGQKLELPEIASANLVYNSKMAAKVDSALVQDGYGIYHHAFFFTKSGAWTVVQQGMNTANATARRYHWHSEDVDDLIVEPHTAIVSEKTAAQIALNMTSTKAEQNRNLSVELVQSGYETMIKDVQLLRKHFTKYSKTLSLNVDGEKQTLLSLAHTEFGPWDHPVAFEDFSKSKYLEKVLAKLDEHKPKNYEELVSTTGVGPKTIRALSLVSEVIYGAKAAYEDPARYSFAHGGKDATPYPVDRQTYDETIEIMKQAVTKTKLVAKEKDSAIKRLGV